MKKIATIIFLCIAAPTGLYAQTAFKDNSGKYGLEDNQGKVIIPGKYDHIDTFSTEGLALVRLSIKYGFIDKTGKEVVAPEYYSARGFSEGLAAVAYYDDNLNAIRWAYVDITGKKVIYCEKDRIAGPFYYGFAKVMMKDTRKWGVIDKTGKEIVAPKYDEMDFFSEGMMAVKLDDKWGYIDSTGKEVIPCKYGFAGRFAMGRALVLSDGETAHIDKKGAKL